MKRASSAAAIVLLALATRAAAWSDVWSTNATPRGMEITTNLWLVRNYTQEVVTVPGTNVWVDAGGGYWTNTPVVVTNEVEFWTHISPNSNHVDHVVTNGVWLDIKERRALEAYWGIVEMEYVTSALVDTSIFYAGLPFFYRHEWRNLDFVKRYVADAFRGGTDRQYFSTSNGWSRPVDAHMTTLSWQSVTSLLAWAQAPTNWCAWTPPRNIGGFGRALDHTGSTTWVISTTNAGAVTQVVYNLYGDLEEIVGTNGQRISSVSTSLYILPGYTSHDYGWRWADNVLNGLSWRSVDAAVFATGEAGSGYGSTCKDALLIAAGNWSNAGGDDYRRFWDLEYFGASGLYYAMANALLETGIVTNWDFYFAKSLPVVVDGYSVIGPTTDVHVAAWVEPLGVFDPQGSSFVATNTWYLVQSGTVLHPSYTPGLLSQPTNLHMDSPFMPVGLPPNRPDCSPFTAGLLGYNVEWVAGVAISRQYEYVDPEAEP